MSNKKSLGTQSVHVDEIDEVTNAVVSSISLSTTFKTKRETSPKRSGNSKVGKINFEYSRSNNPTRHLLEEGLARLEQGKYGIALASGSACTALLAEICFKKAPNSHILCMSDVYGGTYRYFTKLYKNVSFCDMTNLSSLKEALKKQKDVPLVWIETPTNPTLLVVDIQEAVKIVKEFNSDCIVVVDNTFCSPILQQPLTLGADIVVHSITKYINGHSDAVMGICITNDAKLAEEMNFMRNCLGNVPSPFDCYLVMRGIKTLHLRMQRHSENGMIVSKYLEKHPLVEKVIYPGLESHPQHAIAKKQMGHFYGKTAMYGGMISFILKGEYKDCVQFLDTLSVFVCAESLGGVESLAEHPASMTHASVDPKDRENLGINDGFIRLSCGVEDTQDLLDDLDTGFKSISK